MSRSSQLADQKGLIDPVHDNLGIPAVGMRIEVGDYTTLTEHPIDSHLATCISGHEDTRVLGGKTLSKQSAAMYYGCHRGALAWKSEYSRCNPTLISARRVSSRDGGGSPLSGEAAGYWDPPIRHVSVIRSVFLASKRVLYVSAWSSSNPRISCFTSWSDVKSSICLNSSEATILLVRLSVSGVSSSTHRWRPGVLRCAI